MQSSIGGTRHRAERTHSQSAELGGRSDESVLPGDGSQQGAILPSTTRHCAATVAAGRLVFEMVIDGSGNIAEIACWTVSSMTPS